MHCHHFNHIPIDLMNSIKSLYDNFRYTLLYGDSRLDKIKNKFISEATLTYIKHSEDSVGPFLTKNLTP